MKKIVTNLAVVLSFIPLFLVDTGCSREQQATVAPESVRDVETIVVQRANLPSYYEAVGSVRPVQSTQISAQVMGNLVRVNVREGDHVSKGQVLASIDDSPTRASLARATAGQDAARQEIAAADADFALADSTLKRYQSLLEKKSVSPHEFDEVKNRYEAAKARREMIRASLAGADAAAAQARTSQAFTVLRAPFTGVITAKLAETGTLAAPGTPIFTVEDISSYRLETTIDERGIAAVRLGQNVPVSVDAIGDANLTGKVVQILPAADPASRTFLVKIELPKNANIRSGLFGRARFRTGTRESLAVPRTAIVQRGTMQAVYVLGPDQMASLRYVTLGSPDENSVEVLSGVGNGEKIVVRPGDRELNGKKIEVR